MSVINQMLVDLERRRASGEERNHIPDHVRALPGESQAARLPAYGIAGAMAVVALLAIAGWWWASRAPGLSTPVSPAPTPMAVAAPPAPQPQAQSLEVESVAQRFSLELSPVPERAPEPAPMREAPPITTTSIIEPDPAPVPKPKEVVPQKPSPAPSPPVVQKAAPAAPAVTASAPPSPVEIDKQIRQPTPRQRADAEYAKGAAALHRRQFAEARIALEAALQMDPMHHGARQALVGVLLDSREPAEAIKVLQDGLQLAPAQQGFAMTLARLQVENGQLDAGVQTLERSLDYPGVSADYFAFYAGLLQRQNKHAEASVQFQNALARRGNVGLWLLGLGVSLEALGNNADAQEAYRRAKASGNLSDELQAFVNQRMR